MENNNGGGSTIVMTLVGVATLLVALVGATFAYFSTRINNNNAQSISITTVAPTALVYRGGTLLELPNALPGDATPTTGTTGQFTISNGNTASSIAQTYDLKFVVDTNEFTKVHTAVPQDPDDVSTNMNNRVGQLLVKATIVSTSGSNTPVFSGTGVTVTGTGTAASAKMDFTDGTTYGTNSSIKFVNDQLIAKNETHTYRLQIEFHETGLNQDENKGATFTGHVEVEDAKSAS